MSDYRLSAELEPIHEKFRDDATEKLENEGIKSGVDYLNEIAGGSKTFGSDFADSEIPLKAFTRIYPDNNQDVAIVGLKPRVNESVDEPSNTLKRLAESTTSINQFVSACAEDYLASYLDRNQNASKNGIHHFIDLLEERDIISYPPDGREKYISTGAIFEDIYFTNWLKFGADEEKDIDDVPDGIAERSIDCLVEELEAIDVDVVFAFGGKTHNQLAEHLTPKTDDAPPARSNVGEVHGHAYELTLDCDTDCILLGHYAAPRGGWYDAPDGQPQLHASLDRIDL